MPNAIPLYTRLVPNEYSRSKFLKTGRPPYHFPAQQALYIFPERERERSLVNFYLDAL
jgi:hypothetical protein